MNLILFIAGIASLGYGVFTVVSDKHNKRMREVWKRNETALDRKVFPGKQGDSISRYLAGSGFVAIGILLLIFAFLGSSGIAAALTGSTAITSTTTPNVTEQPISITQAIPGQGSIVSGLLAGSSSPTVLPSFGTTTAAASTTPGKGILSQQNKLSVTGSCVVKTSGNAKQCAIYVTYTTAAGDPVLGVPVTIATMNGEGMFVDVDGPLLLKNVSGKVVQYSGAGCRYVCWTSDCDEHAVRGADAGWSARTGHVRVKRCEKRSSEAPGGRGAKLQAHRQEEEGELHSMMLYRVRQRR